MRTMLLFEEKVDDATARHEGLAKCIKVQESEDFIDGQRPGVPSGSPDEGRGKPDDRSDNRRIERVRSSEILLTIQSSYWGPWLDVRQRFTVEQVKRIDLRSGLRHGHDVLPVFSAHASIFDRSHTRPPCSVLAGGGKSGDVRLSLSARWRVTPSISATSEMPTRSNVSSMNRSYEFHSTRSGKGLSTSNSSRPRPDLLVLL